MSYTISSLLSDAKTTAATAFTSGAFFMGPPDKAQIVPWGFLEYGGGEIEQASDEVTTHTLLFHCLVPLKGNLVGDTTTNDGEYAQAIALAHAVHRAFYTNVMIGGSNDAAIGSPGTIAKPDLFDYAGIRHVRCILTVMCVTSEDVSAQLSV